MDGRWKWALAGGALVGLVGCSTTDNPPPFVPPPNMVGQSSVFVPEPPDDSVAKEGPVSPATVLIYAGLCVETLQKEPNKPAAEKEQVIARARHLYHEVLHRDPKNVDALLGLGGLYQVTGEMEKMREVEARAKSMHATNPKVWAWVALRRAQAKDFEAAIAAYHQAVTLDPDNRQYRIHLGLTLARAGRYDEGRDWLMKCMREGEARYNLAMMMLHNKDMEKARMEFNLVLHADPSMVAAKDQLLAMAATGAAAIRSDIKTVSHEEVQPAREPRP
jgi:Tfp pilus assembly protein PilF